jgi:hypothetical protein
VQVSTDYKTCGMHWPYRVISYHDGAYAGTKRWLSLYNRKRSLHSVIHSFIHKMSVFKPATPLP